MTGDVVIPLFLVLLFLVIVLFCTFSVNAIGQNRPEFSMEEVSSPTSEKRHIDSLLESDKEHHENTTTLNAKNRTLYTIKNF